MVVTPNGVFQSILPTLMGYALDDAIAVLIGTEVIQAPVGQIDDDARCAERREADAASADE